MKQLIRLELERSFEANYALARRGSWCESLCSRYTFDKGNVAKLAAVGPA